MDEDLLVIIGIILIALLGIYIYFWPTRIAFKNNNAFKGIVLLVNLFFGWTFIVWFILLLYVYFPKEKTILDPLIDPSGTMSAKKYGNRINDLKTHSNKITSMKQLYELKQMGAITEQEFQEHRNRLNF